MGSSLLPPYRKPLVPGSCLTYNFDPLSLEPSFYLNMAANGDANDTVYETLVDSSGNGRNFTASTANMLVKTNVQNGNRVVRFPGGANDSYTRTSANNLITASAWFMLIAGKVTADTAPGGFPLADPCIFSDETGLIGVGYNNNTPLIGVANSDNGSAYQVTSSTPDSNFHIWMARHDSGSIYWSQDNGADTSAVSGNTFTLGSIVIRIGANYNDSAEFKGDIGALLICPTVPTLAQRTAAFNYFKAVWGTP